MADSRLRVQAPGETGCDRGAPVAGEANPEGKISAHTAPHEGLTIWGRKIIDAQDATIIFTGLAKNPLALTSAEIWRISRRVIGGGVTDETYADLGKFNQIWNDRLTIFPPVVPPPFSNLKSVLFGGVNEFVVVGGVGNFERTTKFSISCWFKTSSAAAEFIVSRQANSGLFPGWNMFIEAGQIKAALINNNGTSNRIFIRTNSTFNDSNWHHLVMTYDGSSNTSGLFLYLDGSLEAITVITNALSASILTSANFQISGRDGPNVVLNGSVDETAIYDKNLSAAEVTEIYNSGIPKDLSSLTTSANLLNWWRMGDGDIFPTLLDNISTDDATMVNMESGDITLDVPS